MVPASHILVFGVWPALMLRNEGRRLRLGVLLARLATMLNSADFLRK
jgi:hypothetical protein